MQLTEQQSIKKITPIYQCDNAAFKKAAKQFYRFGLEYKNWEDIKVDYLTLYKLAVKICDQAPKQNLNQLIQQFELTVQRINGEGIYSAEFAAASKDYQRSIVYTVLICATVIGLLLLPLLSLKIIHYRSLRDKSRTYSSPETHPLAKVGRFFSSAAREVTQDVTQVDAGKILINTH